jgi:hypothetical protein
MEGYVYCMTNEYMPNFVKVGYTDRTPEERLAEANGDTWSIPVWKCETSVKVRNPRDAEKVLHKILSYEEGRVSSRREFFSASVEAIKNLFDLLRTQQDEIPASPSVCSPLAGGREYKKIFRDGQVLKHIYKGDEAMAIYMKEKDCFMWRGTEYGSLSRLNAAHKQSINPELKSAGNAWDEWLAIDENGNFVPVKHLPPLQETVFLAGDL